MFGPKKPAELKHEDKTPLEVAIENDDPEATLQALRERPGSINHTTLRSVPEEIYKVKLNAPELAVILRSWKAMSAMLEFFKTQISDEFRAPAFRRVLFRMTNPVFFDHQIALTLAKEFVGTPTVAEPDYGHTWMHDAVEHGNSEMIAILHLYHPDLLNEHNDRIETPVEMALLQDNEQKVTTLFDRLTFGKEIFNDLIFSTARSALTLFAMSQHQTTSQLSQIPEKVFEKNILPFLTRDIPEDEKTIPPATMSYLSRRSALSRHLQRQNKKTGEELSTSSEKNRSRTPSR